MKLIKTAAFYTLGCKVNQYETESIKKIFLDKGIEIVNFEEAADVYIVNTCTVTSIADRKTRNILRRAKKQNKYAILAATGCYAQTDAEELKNIEEIDIISGNIEKSELYNIIEKFIAEKEKQNKNKFQYVKNIYSEEIYHELDFSVYREMTRAYIKIQDGCNNYCTYCKIPYARGKNRSRSLENILKEVEILEKEGFKEIILIGINLGAYGEDLNSEDIGIEDVIEKISEKEGIKRIRLGSVYPDKLTEKFIKILEKNKKVMPHLHISLQSGDDKILKDMGRQYNTQYVKERLNYIREKVPDILFTGDIITGFPGETKENFQNTYNFLKEISFSDLHIFKYSERKNTKAASFKMKVSPNEKNKRAELLEKLRDEMYNEVRKKFIGKDCFVLIEEVNEGEGLGYTENYLKAKVKDFKGSVNQIEKSYIKGIEKGLLSCEKKE